jgi:hypothetical protein
MEKSKDKTNEMSFHEWYVSSIETYESDLKRHTQLIRACETDDLEQVKVLYNGDKATQFIERSCPLEYAYRNKAWNVARWLAIEANINTKISPAASIHIVGDRELTNKVEMLEAFAKKGADINAPKLFAFETAKSRYINAHWKTIDHKDTTIEWMVKNNVYFAGAHCYDLFRYGQGDRVVDNIFFDVMSTKAARADVVRIVKALIYHKVKPTAQDFTHEKKESMQDDHHEQETSKKNKPVYDVTELCKALRQQSAHVEFGDQTPREYFMDTYSPTINEADLFDADRWEKDPAAQLELCMPENN